MQNLSDKYKVWIKRICRATGYGKGLIDSISSFATKAVLRRDTITKDCWFQNSSKIFEYLESRCDSRMSDINLDAKTIDENRLRNRV